MPTTWDSNSMYHHTAHFRRRQVWGRRSLSAALVSAILAVSFTVDTSRATTPSDYPMSGVIGQGGVQVQLGYNSECVGGVGTATNGESVCLDVATTTGVEVHPVPLLTPGVVRIRLSVAARVVSVRDGKVSGAIAQRVPSEAVISFGSALPSGSLAVADVEYHGARYVFVFKPVDALRVTRMTCRAGRAVVGVASGARGRLGLQISEGGRVIGRTVREVAPGWSVLHVKLTGSVGGLGDRCLVHVSLMNRWGRGSVSLRTDE
jgi:hypothetical protein